MRTIILLLFCLGEIGFANGQADSINRIDSAGKKDGKWLIYYNSRMQEVKDTNKAYYSRYTYYYHDTDVYAWPDIGENNWRLKYSEGSTPQKGRIQQLDGEYTWTDDKGRKRMVMEFKNGYISIDSEYYKSGAVLLVMDYTKKYMGKPFSYRYCEWDKNGTASYYWFDIYGKYGFTGFQSSEDGN